MLIRIDARKLTDPAGLFAALAEVFGFTPGSGQNLDALVDSLTHLDDSQTRPARVQVFPGEVVLLAVEHTHGLGKAAAAQVKTLADMAAFVNWRRLEKGQPPLLAVACDRE